MATILSPPPAAAVPSDILSRSWMNEIHPNLLWLAHALDVRENRPLFDADITAVVDGAFEEPLAQLPLQLIYCRFLH